MQGKLSIRGIRVIPDMRAQGGLGNSAEDLKAAAALYAEHPPELHILRFSVEDTNGKLGFVDISAERGELYINMPAILVDSEVQD